MKNCYNCSNIPKPDFFWRLPNNEDLQKPNHFNETVRELQIWRTRKKAHKQTHCLVCTSHIRVSLHYITVSLEETLQLQDKNKLIQTLSFSGLQTLTNSRWSSSQSTGLSRWNIKMNSTINGRSFDLNSLPTTFTMTQNACHSIFTRSNHSSHQLYLTAQLQIQI